MASAMRTAIYSSPTFPRRFVSSVVQTQTQTQTQGKALPDPILRSTPPRAACTGPPTPTPTPMQPAAATRRHDISFDQRGVQRLEQLLKEKLRAQLHQNKTATSATPNEVADMWAVHMQSSSGGAPGEPDRNKVKLGRTLRILQDRLPTLLQSPLPQDILAPNISLHLFPSTHPHLPTVSGRVAYTAALWTSPIAWNRVPLVGNVRVDIVSERMGKQSLALAPRRDGALPEQLVVRWRTAAEQHGGRVPVIGVQALLDAHPDGASADAAATDKSGEDFTGLYIFQFDGEGRILSHTIELAQAGGKWEQGVGAKVVGLTDWLLGEIKGRPGSEPGSACPAFEQVDGR